MNVEEETQFLLAKFCSKDEMLKYFFQFRDKVKGLEDRIPIQNFADFLKALQLFEKYNFLKKNKSLEDVSSVKEGYINSGNSEFFSVLISCLDIIVYKIAKLHLEMNIDLIAEDCFETEAMFDVIICLLKILILEIKGKSYFEDLLNYLTNFFTVCAEQNKFSSISSMSACPLYDYSLKFLMSLLKCVPVTDHLNYITYETCMKLFCVLPLLDLKTSKFFLNHILPIITSFCNLSFTEDVLRSIWNLIISNYSYDNCYDKNIGIYTLFYSLAENVYNDFSHNRTFYIHNNISFWQMILMGLTSRHSFITKRSLCIFKIFLFWVKTKNTNIVILDCGVSLFAVKSMKDLPVWNDVITLFETLEEKQAHVIKPVLPKFLRIIQLTSTSISDVQHKDLILHTSWLLHLLKRMLNHENKYIVKWALSTAMNLDFQICPISQQNSKLFIQIIIEAFNDQNLFSRTEGKDGYFRWLSAKKIQKFLTHYISVFETESERVDLMRNLLSIIACQSWCGVALLHFTFALSRMDSMLAWDQKDLINMRKVILDLQRTQAQVFRAALEHCLLETCINFLDWNSISSNDLGDLLMLFKTDVVLHSRPRNKLLMKLKEMFSSGAYKLTLSEAYKYCAECIQRVDASCSNADAGFEIICSSEMKKTVRIFVLFLEAFLISSLRNEEACSNWYSLFKPILCTLSSAHNRPYMSAKKFLNALHFIIILYQEVEGCSADEKGNIHANIVVENRTEFVEFMYQKVFMNLKNDIDVSQSNVIFDALHLLSSLEAYKCAFYNNLPVLLKKCELFIEDSSLRNSQLLASCRIFNFLFCHLPDTEQLMKSRLDYHLLLNIMQENILQFNLSKPGFVKNVEKNEWIEFTTKSVCDFWNVAILIIKYSTENEMQNLLSFLMDSARNTFEQGPVAAVLPTLKCLKVLISKFDSCSLHSISDLLDTSWKACIELRGNEIFRPALRCFIEIIFQPEMIYFYDVLCEYTEKLQKLEENTVGVFYYLIKHFCNVFSLEALINSKFDSIPLLVQALTYGPIHHKGQRVMEETIAYIINLDNDLAASISDVSEPSFCVRIIAIDFLMKNLHHKSGCNAKEKENFVVNLINSLIDADISVNYTRTSRFVNSYSHRLRNRIWQVILILQKNVHSIENVEKLLLRVQTSLESDNQQPSVRYFQEWIIFNFLYSFKCLLSSFISTIEQSTEKRPGMIISLLSVLVLLISHDVLKSKCDILQCFPIIINFCMAQNFTVRLYAQLALNKLFSLCQKENYSDIILKYDFILKIIESQNVVNGVGNFYKNIQKLSDDFYFSSFHPIEHLSFQTIFFHIPRLSNIAPDEWIKPSMIEKYVYSDLNYPLSLYNCDEKLNSSIATSWSSKSNCEMPVDDYDSVDYNFQKKVCPWQDTLNNELNDDLFGERKQKTSSDLIVVASLIDRIPNLGGLCRTCEVFGVSEFVIGCLKYREDKQFQNLAVSSDKWISIKEVKPYHLKEYLISLKEKGYSLIGAEQADDSHKLTNYKFPRKSVLLLGHEKEGLPVDFIQLLDDCVEIPQQGITRSLNVHVSGAILIWEYSRQHLYSL